jgi:hypothetical protein
VRLIVPVLAGGLGWWLSWLAFGRPETWPYLAAYVVAGPLLMLFWGWAEERLGYEAAARPEDEVSVSAVPDAGTTIRGTRLRTGMGRGQDRHQLGAPQPNGRHEEIDAPEGHSRALADVTQ